jgi:putative hemolysin
VNPQTQFCHFKGGKLIKIKRTTGQTVLGPKKGEILQETEVESLDDMPKISNSPNEWKSQISEEGNEDVWVTLFLIKLIFISR